ncbi:hypothetical protein ACE4V3_04715 (plasmid) [Borrelia recurrentis]|uniref:Lipoprotein n=1 Tax=Borrelia recurrentis (strain A1) TaxID=412418 RepID=B5RS10_BORRA|nr:hypothetical protein [Borrelia recurrentis]ACH95146.1 hypothetical protein BRE_1095 [Borrelia recurrentis A1]
MEKDFYNSVLFLLLLTDMSCGLSTSTSSSKFPDEKLPLKKFTSENVDAAKPGFNSQDLESKFDLKERRVEAGGRQGGIREEKPEEIESIKNFYSALMYNDKVVFHSVQKMASGFEGYSDSEEYKDDQPRFYRVWGNLGINKLSHIMSEYSRLNKKRSDIQWMMMNFDIRKIKEHFNNKLNDCDRNYALEFRGAFQKDDFNTIYDGIVSVMKAYEENLDVFESDYERLRIFKRIHSGFSVKLRSSFDYISNELTDFNVEDESQSKMYFYYDFCVLFGDETGNNRYLQFVEKFEPIFELMSSLREEIKFEIEDDAVVSQFTEVFNELEDRFKLYLKEVFPRIVSDDMSFEGLDSYETDFENLKARVMDY